MRRCKLISPTNLMLEHPILSPVDEDEYILLGVKEHRKQYREAVCFGVLIGAGGLVGLGFLFLAVKLVMP